MMSRGEGYRVYHRNQTQHFAGKSGGRSHWLTFEGSKKNVKNPLTNHPSCDTIRVQKERARLLDGAEIVCDNRAVPKRLESALANLKKSA